MALATKFNLRISQFDVETTYLNGKIDTKVFREQPELLGEMLRRIASTDTNFELSRRPQEMLEEVSGTAKVCKLNKALYSLRQAGRQWHAELDAVFQDAGLIPTSAGPCVYVSGNKQIFLLVYVDDILIFSNDQEG